MKTLQAWSMMEHCLVVEERVDRRDSLQELLAWSKELYSLEVDLVDEHCHTDSSVERRAWNRPDC